MAACSLLILHESIEAKEEEKLTAEDDARGDKRKEGQVEKEKNSHPGTLQKYWLSQSTGHWPLVTGYLLLPLVCGCSRWNELHPLRHHNLPVMLCHELSTWLQYSTAQCLTPIQFLYYNRVYIC